MKPKLVKELPLAERETLSCIFCTSKEDDEFLFGQFYTIGKQQLSLTVHYYCLLFASGLEQKGKDSQGIFGFLKKDILSAAERGKLIECHKCHTLGATVVCSDTTCERIYHFPCTSSSKMINQYFGFFNSFCADHLPTQKVPDSFLGMSQATCIICQEEVLTPEPSYDLLWAPCCKKQSWFHRDCIQRLALSAGCHFFKCPICSNNELFFKEMQEMGIYVPDQDASWEAEPHAFRDLYQRHNQCDHPTCICPRGRSHVGRLWKLMLCSSCGSKGLHISCGNLDPKRNEWNCENCRQIPVESSSQSQRNPSNTGSKAPSELAAPKRPRPARKYVSGACNNDISEDGSEVEIIPTAVAGPSNCAHSSFHDPKPSCSTDGAQSPPHQVRIAEQMESASGSLDRPLPQTDQNTVPVRAGSSGTPPFSVADDGHQEVTASAASNQMDHTKSLVVDHQQERIIQADNQEEKANDHDEGILELMLCKSCGFIGLHTSYGNLDAQGNEWNCDSCRRTADESSSQSHLNPSNTGLEAPSESAAPERPNPGSEELSSTSNNDISEDESEVEFISTVAGSSNYAHSSYSDPKPSCSSDGARSPPRKVQIAEQTQSTSEASEPPDRPMAKSVQNTVPVREGSSGSTQPSVTSDDHQEVTSSAASSETDQVDHQQETINIVNHQQERRIPADNQGEKANDEAPSIVHRPTDLTQINSLQQIGESYGTSSGPIHPTGAIPPQTPARNQGPSPVHFSDPPPGDYITPLLNTLEGYYHLQDIEEIAKILMHFYAGNKDCPVLKHLMLVLIKQPFIALGCVEKVTSAGAITAAIINFIKLRVGSSDRLDEFPKFKSLLLDLYSYTFLHLYERDQKLNGEVNEEEKRKEENMLDTYRLASSLLDFSGELADCIEHKPEILLFAADCSGRAGLKKGGIKCIMTALFFLERFKKSLEAVTDNELKVHLIEKEATLKKLICDVKNVPNDNELESGRGGSHQVPSSKGPPVKGPSMKRAALRAANYPKIKAARRIHNPNYGISPECSDMLQGSGPSAVGGVPPVPIQHSENATNRHEIQGIPLGIPPIYNLEGSGPSAGGGAPPIPIQQRQHAPNWYQNEGMRQGQYNIGMPLNPYYNLQESGPPAGGRGIPIQQREHATDWQQGMGQGQPHIGMPQNSNYNVAGSGPPAGGGVPLVPSQQEEPAVHKDPNQGIGQGQNNTGMPPNCPSNREGSHPSAGEGVPQVPSQHHEHAVNKDLGQDVGKVQNNIGMPPICTSNREGSGPSAGEGVPLVPSQQHEPSVKKDQDQGMGQGQNNVRIPHNGSHKLVGSGPLAGGGVPLAPSYQYEHAPNWNQNRGMGRGQNNFGMPQNPNYNYAGSGPLAGGGAPSVPFQQPHWNQNQGMGPDQYNFGNPPNYNHAGSGPSAGGWDHSVPFQQPNWGPNQRMGQGQYNHVMPPDFSYNHPGSDPSFGGGFPPIPSQQREHANWNQNQGMGHGQNNVGMPRNHNSAGKWIPPVPSQQYEHAPNWYQNQGMGHGQNNMRMPPYSSYNGGGSGPSSTYSAGERVPSHQHEHARYWNQNPRMDHGRNNIGMPHNRNYNLDGSGPSAGGGPSLGKWRSVPIAPREQSVINWYQSQGLGLDRFNHSVPTKQFTCHRCNGHGHYARDCATAWIADGLFGTPAHEPRPENRTLKIEIPLN